MDSLDDYFDYALDQLPEQREALLQSLRASDPQLAEQLAAMLQQLVTNPDFGCQGTAVAASEPEPTRVLALTLPVDDIAAAIRWYGDVLQARLVTQASERAVMAIGDVELHLVPTGHGGPTCVVHRRDVANLGQTTRAADGSRSLHLVDPWGNPFVVTDRATASG
jgi:catechol-2,3-dioxygenase